MFWVVFPVGIVLLFVCVEAPMRLFCPHTVLQDSSGVGFPTAKAILVLSQVYPPANTLFDVLATIVLSLYSW